MKLLDKYAVQFYIDPSTNPLRIAARAAYARREGEVERIRAIIATHSDTPRPLSLFDATVSSCQYYAENAKAAKLLQARGRTEWSEAV